MLLSAILGWKICWAMNLHEILSKKYNKMNWKSYERSTVMSVYENRKFLSGTNYSFNEGRKVVQGKPRLENSSPSTTDEKINKELVVVNGRLSQRSLVDVVGLVGISKGSIHSIEHYCRIIWACLACLCACSKRLDKPGQFFPCLYGYYSVAHRILFQIFVHLSA